MNYCYGKGVQKFVLCWEVVPFSEGALSEVPLHMHESTCTKTLRGAHREVLGSSVIHLLSPAPARLSASSSLPLGLRIRTGERRRGDLSTDTCGHTSTGKMDAHGNVHGDVCGYASMFPVKDIGVS